MAAFRGRKKLLNKKEIRRTVVEKRLPFGETGGTKKQREARVGIQQKRWEVGWFKARENRPRGIFL